MPGHDDIVVDCRLQVLVRLNPWGHGAAAQIFEWHAPYVDKVNREDSALTGKTNDGRIIAMAR